MIEIEWYKRRIEWFRNWYWLNQFTKFEKNHEIRQDLKLIQTRSCWLFCHSLFSQHFLSTEVGVYLSPTVCSHSLCGGLTNLQVKPLSMTLRQKIVPGLLISSQIRNTRLMSMIHTNRSISLLTTLATSAVSCNREEDFKFCEIQIFHGF